MIRLTKLKQVLLFGFGCIVLMAGQAAAGDNAHARFYFQGDGEICLLSEKNKAVFCGRYRQGGRYEEAAYKAICRVFDAPYREGQRHLSLRLLAFLDYLQDHFKPGARITITSGYRPPAYNQALRRRGALAAKASLHQYGMAADFKMEGVSSKRIWTYVKALGFGGAGYYQGESVHIDVGPARFWDAKTSGVGSGLADENKLIGLITDFDIYTPGDSIVLRFIRMTAFPIKVKQKFVLLRYVSGSNPQWVYSFSPRFVVQSENSPCLRFESIDQMASIRWRLPLDLPPGRYQVRSMFCAHPWKQMPGAVVTPEFEITNPR
jgi:uncharacterized protein YcbK (DUF882 family)